MPILARTAQPGSFYPGLTHSIGTRNDHMRYTDRGGPGSIPLGVNQVLIPQLRYNTGEPKFVGDKPILYPTDTGLLNRAHGLLGTGVTDTTPLPGQAQATATAQKRSNTAADNYRRLLSKYGTGGLLRSP